MWPVKLYVGYGNLYLAKRAEPGCLIKIVLPKEKKKNLQKKATVHKSAVSLSAFCTNLRC